MKRNEELAELIEKEDRGQDFICLRLEDAREIAMALKKQDEPEVSSDEATKEFLRMVHDYEQGFNDLFTRTISISDKIPPKP